MPRLGVAPGNVSHQNAAGAVGQDLPFKFVCAILRSFSSQYNLKNIQR